MAIFPVVFIIAVVVSLESQNNMSFSRWPNRGEQTNGLCFEWRSHRTFLRLYCLPCFQMAGMSMLG